MFDGIFTCAHFPHFPMETNRSTQYRPNYSSERVAPRKRTMMWLIDTREISNIAFVVRSGMLQILLTRAEYDRSPDFEIYDEDENDEELEAAPAYSSKSRYRKPAYPVRPAPRTSPRLNA
jgi:hypothetical protein